MQAGHAGFHSLFAMPPHDCGRSCALNVFQLETHVETIV